MEQPSQPCVSWDFVAHRTPQTRHRRLREDQMGPLCKGAQQIVDSIFRCPCLLPLLPFILNCGTLNVCV